MNLFTNSETPSSNLLQRPYSGDFDPAAYVPEYCAGSWKNRPIADKQRRKSTNSREEKLDRNSEAVSGTIVKNSKCFQRTKQKLLFLYNSLEKGSPKKCKTICACIQKCFQNSSLKCSSRNLCP
jgi:hypothetical protein